MNFWQPTLKAATERRYPVMLVNDDDRMVKGRIVLGFENADRKVVSTHEVPFTLDPLGQITLSLPLTAPQVPGNYLLKATALSENGTTTESTLSRRKVKVE